MTSTIDKEGAIFGMPSSSRTFPLQCYGNVFETVEGIDD